MSFLSTLGRMTLSTVFIQSGVNGLQNPGMVAQVAEANDLPEPELLERIHHTTNVVAGATMALGIFPRLSGLALLANLVPATVLAHDPSDVDGERETANQTVHAAKNISLVGALLMVIGTKSGDPDDDEFMDELVAELDAELAAADDD